MTLATRNLLFAAATLIVSALPSLAQAQNPVLAEMYGRGVHAFFAGQYDDAYQRLSLAIDNGLQDPRAYYFRGLAANASGRQYEAESDWQMGAELEASGKGAGAIGRSLARIQGSSRLQLEAIRQKAKLEAVARTNARSQQRYGELGASPQEVSGVTPGAAPGAARSPVAPPPTPPAAGADNPFADDLDMAGGEPRVDSADAFGNVVDNVPMDAPAAAGDAPAAGGADPFNAPAAGAGADPFGAPAAGAGADPFGAPAGGADPFGAPAGGGADPFGGDPFGN